MSHATKKPVPHRQAILWVSYTLMLSVMFAGMTETAPGSGKYDWNTLSSFLMLPATIGLFAVPIVSIVWASNKRRVQVSHYTSVDARRAWAQALDWEAVLEAEVSKLVR